MSKHYRLPAEVRCDYCSRRYSGDDKDEVMAAHVKADHRAEWIASRMAALERIAKWSVDAGDWATDETAVEYRALLKEWWTLPAVSNEAMRLSPSRNRMLTGRGTLTDKLGGDTSTARIPAKLKALQTRANGAASFSEHGTQYTFVREVA